MNIQDYATHYLRFWHQDPDGNWQLGDSAPSRFWTFVAGLPKHTDRNMLHAALVGIASKKPVPEPPVSELLEWLNRHPKAISRCDAVLKKGKSASLKDVLEKAYSQEVYALADAVHQFLSKEV